MTHHLRRKENIGHGWFLGLKVLTFNVQKVNLLKNEFSSDRNKLQLVGVTTKL